jgi:alkanesulfonate monooxygenase SsuD/methylene tetrahydromethanopterin reductase-like flavin-dependent oxidoreductase (luciferase family)
MAHEWPHSPWVAEFQDRVGFALLVFPIETPVDPARHLLAAGRLAEELGYDAILLADHPAWGLECFVHMAVLAATTTRIRIGTNVICTSYRHPVHLARLAADLDNLSNGRLMLGLGVGWDANEFANLGMTFPSVRERQEALEEAIAIMRGVWGPEPFTYRGRQFQTTNAHVAPPPRQRPAPPIMIAGGGERVTLRQVAQYADACILSTFGIVGGTQTPDGIRHKLAVLRDHCAVLGRPYDTILRTHFTGWLVLAEDEQRLDEKVRHYFPQGMAARYSGPWEGYAIAGTPERMIDYYRSLVDAGIQYFLIGTLDAADQETIRLMAEHVIPAFAR